LIDVVLVMTLYQILPRCFPSQGILTPLNAAGTNLNHHDIATERWIDSAERAAMKDVFQRDIDSTVAEILAHETPCGGGDEVSKELQFEGKGTLGHSCAVIVLA
jgi:hypothetical protein